MKTCKQFSFLLLTIFCCISVKAQKVELDIKYLTEVPGADANTIVYNQHRKLGIADFKATPDEESVAAAITSSGFMFKAGYRSFNGKATLMISVYCSFDKATSWMKENAKNNYILSHEQHHFDISYISTLLFIKKIKKTSFKQGNYMDRLKEVYSQAVADMETLQHRYDTETHNGILKDKQAEWNKKIDDQLVSLIAENN
jgi:hypothetical protein